MLNNMLTFKQCDNFLNNNEQNTKRNRQKNIVFAG